MQMRKNVEDEDEQSSRPPLNNIPSPDSDCSANSNQKTLKDKLPKQDSLCFERIEWTKRGLEVQNFNSVEPEPTDLPIKLFIPLGDHEGERQGSKKDKLTIPGMAPRESLIGMLKINKKRPSFANDIPVPVKEETPLKKRNETKIVAFFSTLGRIIRAIKKIRERLNYSNIANINMLQLQLINDKSHLEDEYINSAVANDKGKKKANPALVRTKTQKKLKRSGIIFFIEIAYKYGSRIKMFHPLNRVLMLWKALLCFFIVFEIFNISIRLFFHRFWDSKDNQLSAYDFFLKLLMFFDIICVMNTGIFKSGAVIFKRRDAVKMYLQKSFLIDTLALLSLFLPYYESEPIADDRRISSLPALYSSSTNILKFFFFLKVHHLSSMYKYLEEILLSEEMYEGLLSLFKLFFQIIFISHLIACAWNFTAAVSRIQGSSAWYDKIFYEQDPTPVTWSKEYLYSWYWSLTTMITVGYGDISPRNDAEVAVASVAMLFGCGFFAYAISSIGFIVEKFDQKKKNLRKDIRVINKYMIKKHVDFELQVRVRKYLEHLWLEEDFENKDTEGQIINRLSDSLREELLVQSHGKVLANFSFFTNFFSEETLEKVSQIVKTINYAPEDIITYEGEPSNKLLYFILKGTVEIYFHSTKTGKSLPLKNLGEGDCFGQLSFFTEQERNFHARSRDFTTVYTLHREEFLEIIKKNPEDFESFHLIKDNIILYEDISKLGIKCESCDSNRHLFKECPYLKYKPDRDLLVRRYLYSEPMGRISFSRKATQKSSSALLFKALFSDLQMEFDASRREESEGEDHFSSNEASFLEKERKASVIFEAHQNKEEEESDGATPITLSRDINASQISIPKGGDQRQEESQSVLNMGGKKMAVTRLAAKKTTVRFEKLFDETSLDERGMRKPTLTLNEIDLSPETRKRNSVPHKREPTITVPSHKLDLKRQSTNKTNHNLNHASTSPGLNSDNSHNQTNLEPVAYFDKEIPLIFGGLNIDRLHLYSYYYPYNNCTYVIEYMKKVSKSTSRVRSEKARTLSKGRVGAEAMLEFRNQQRYFLINKTKNKVVKVKQGMSPKRGRSVFKKEEFGFGALMKEIGK